MISIISAIQKENRGIGKNNDLLHKIKDDLRRFKEVTMGHPIVMGENTFKSLGMRPLPGRLNVVVSETFPEQKDVVMARTFEEALRIAQEKDSKEIFIIGGGSIYKQAIQYADRLYLTVIEGDLPADIYFPDYSQFHNIISREHRVDPDTGVHYTFEVLEK